ncbi:hypothetical protein OIU78_002947 [Salix suchowensis]|nr:hypothetical protein OIU78_002947 [Salix suchowensis]
MELMMGLSNGDMLKFDPSSQGSRSSKTMASDIRTVQWQQDLAMWRTRRWCTLYIFAESYGGKFAATLGVSALKAIEAGELKLQLGGVALGDSWISPEDFVFTFGSSSQRSIKNEQQWLEQRKQLKEIYEDATSSWSELEHVVLSNSNNVDFYNFLLDYVNDPIVGSTAQGSRGVWLLTDTRDI